MEQQQLLDELVTRLTGALGDEVASIVLHGSAAAGDFQEKVSDLNVVCIVHKLGRPQLEAAHDAVDWWMKKGQPAPVLLTVEEIENAQDAFAIEFLDIKAAYRILHGDDRVKHLEVDTAHHRHQVEHELRSLLLRLRERYLAFQKDRKAVIELLMESLSSFSTLFRHALILGGSEAGVRKHEIFQKAAGEFGISDQPFETIMAMRAGNKKLLDEEIQPLFESYLNEITAVAEVVDQLDREATKRP